MELTELIADFRKFTKDKSLPYLWEDEDVIGWYNEAEQEAALRARLLFDKTTVAICQIAVTAGTAIYDLHSLVNEISYAYLVNAGGKRYVLTQTTRETLDIEFPNWRETTTTLKNFIHDDNKIELCGVVGEDFTLYLEVYRGPIQKIEEKREEVPEIAVQHHLHLTKWAMHRAYLVNDSDKYNEKLSAQYLGEFEQYFGYRPQADLRKREQNNKPQQNKVYW